MTAERAAAARDLLDGEMCGVVVRGRKVLLVREGGCVYAYEDRCPHLGVRLSDGYFADGVITCRAHHFQYDARTGQGVNPRNLRLRPYRAALEGDSITVELDEGAAVKSTFERVGPVLEAGSVADAVVAAIRELNPDAEVQDRGAYLRVLAPSPCGVTRDAIERALGRPFRLPAELEMIMPSFKGAFAVTEDGASWETHRP